MRRQSDNWARVLRWAGLAVAALYLTGCSGVTGPDLDQAAADRRLSDTQSSQQPGSSPHADSLASDADGRAFSIQCNTQAMVLARYLYSKRPLLSRDQKHVYTPYVFRIVRVIRDEGQLGPGVPILTYREGDEGKGHVGVAPGMPTYHVGDLYLLPLQRDDSVVRQYRVLDRGTTQIIDTKVYASEPGFMGIKGGTPLTDVLASYQRVAGKSCKGLGGSTSE